MSDADALTRDLPEALHVRLGEVARVPLPSAMGAGNTWSVEPVDGTDLLTAEVEVAPPPRQHGGLPTSASAAETLVVRGTAPGRARLRLVLARSWAPRPPTADHVVEVQITAEPVDRPDPPS